VSQANLFPIPVNSDHTLIIIANRQYVVL